ncbi:MAG TPA: putative porin [Steroidobacteraceae bacterium]|nr:putative porin [Steroidobacteraceae bacterium]
MNQKITRKPFRMVLSALAASAVCAAGAASVARAADHSEEQRLLELRDTVINLIRALVDKGVITREQAEKMIADAKQKAETEVAANVAKEKAQEEADKGAVRVPYVPQIVKDEISKEVAAEIKPELKGEVAAQLSPAGVRSVLPDWLQRLTWTGDVRMRGEADNYDRNNAQFSYLNFNAVNAAGGIVAAGPNAYLNTTDDVDRLRVRVRFGFDADLGDGWTSGMRIATGYGNPIFATTNQTLGTYGQEYQIGIDQGWIRWSGTPSDRQVLSFTGGRFANPFVSTNMVWYNDLTFEGVAGNYRFNLSSDAAHRHDIVATLGAFPLTYETPSSTDKWLLGGQLGIDLRSSSDSRLQFAAAYYDYVHTVGMRNPSNTTIFNYTAPAFVQKGNTMFDIANSTNPNVNLFALAADYRLVDLLLIGDWHALPNYTVSMTAEAVRNVGFNSSQIQARTGTYVAPRTSGYEADVGFGSSVFGPPHSWRAWAGYRYLQRDAVLDAFNDEDFHYGGTDAKGYLVTVDYSFNRRIWTRLRYLSASAINGPPLLVDVLMLDLNAQF